MNALIWFRNDLRIHDHEGLYRASKEQRNQIGVYCFDPRHFQTTTTGFPKTGSFRAQFTTESVKQLRYNLQSLGSDLIVRQKSAVETIAEIHEHSPIDVIYYQKETTREEIREEEEVAALGIPMESYFGQTLVHPEDVVRGISKLPNGFTSWRKKQESNWVIRAEFPIPSLLTYTDTVSAGPIPELEQLGLEPPQEESKGVLPFKGGESEGLGRLQSYFWEQNLLRKYKETRNGMLGADYSSKFSPWLANGSLSARRVYCEVKKYENAIEKNESTYWLVFELLWRDFFRFKSMKLGRSFFQHPAVGREISDEKQAQFEDWTRGKTGNAFIDANMIELRKTGFMSNRGRQNAASFLINDLQIDWLWGAEWFESLLIDYDVASNYGNWTYLAGNGADPRGQRYFNTQKQAELYDPDGAYRAFWLE